MKRKSPIRHRVRAHIRERRHVVSYVRGHGVLRIVSRRPWSPPTAPIALREKPLKKTLGAAYGALRAREPSAWTMTPRVGATERYIDKDEEKRRQLTDLQRQILANADGTVPELYLQIRTKASPSKFSEEVAKLKAAELLETAPLPTWRGYGSTLKTTNKGNRIMFGGDNL